ncbi:MAG: hypothetical protein LBH98_06470 [Chitinispirillales bacterium]|jgi:hypothetical protein|nr:hypothetical protein [Chitinispirillales bacterium]
MKLFKLLLVTIFSIVVMFLFGCGDVTLTNGLVVKLVMVENNLYGNLQEQNRITLTHGMCDIFTNYQNLFKAVAEERENIAASINTKLKTEEWTIDVAIKIDFFTGMQILGVSPNSVEFYPECDIRGIRNDTLFYIWNINIGDEDIKETVEKQLEFLGLPPREVIMSCYRDRVLYEVKNEFYEYTYQESEHGNAFVKIHFEKVFEGAFDKSKFSYLEPLTYVVNLPYLGVGDIEE